MDIAAERQRLESELKDIERWLDHPVAQRILADNIAGQETLIRTICDFPIDSIKAFFDHWQAVGHLRGLRRSQAIVDEVVTEIKDELEKLPNE